LEFGVPIAIGRNLEFGVWNLEIGIWRMEFGD
jgi:hypothetical protein